MIEFKASDPWDYQAPKDQAQICELAPRLWVSVEGTGDPNGADFSAAVGALYGLSYAVRMSYRAPNPPPGAGPYTVGVLQGRWDMADRTKPFDIRHKDNLAWTIMIRQPEFLTAELFATLVEAARAKAAKKKDETAWYGRLKYGRAHEGLFAQILHVGPYDAEPATFERLEALLTQQGYHRSSKIHYEIYLGDPRRSELAKLKTILRIPVARRA